MPRRLQNDRADTLVVLDFETTGLSPAQGDRVIEVGAVVLEHGQIKARFQSLMNPGFPVDRFIESYTGITNEMLQLAPPCAEVIDEFGEFLGDHNLVAHNASFDRRFLDSEFARVNRNYQGDFACSMLVARRVLKDAPDHKLATLVVHEDIPNDGTFHRALADSEMTASLWVKMLERIMERYAVSAPSFILMQKIARMPKASVAAYLARRASDEGVLTAQGS
jgi:DNA polymerase-3 subunit epsilon